MGRVKRVMMADMARMARMGEYWGNGQGIPKRREVRSRDNVVGIIQGMATEKRK